MPKRLTYTVRPSLEIVLPQFDVLKKAHLVLLWTQGHPLFLCVANRKAALMIHLDCTQRLVQLRQGQRTATAPKLYGRMDRRRLAAHPEARCPFHHEGHQGKLSGRQVEHLQLQGAPDAAVEGTGTILSYLRRQSRR